MNLKIDLDIKIPIGATHYVFSRYVLLDNAYKILFYKEKNDSWYFWDTARKRWKKSYKYNQYNLIKIDVVHDEKTY